jgi:hypothetical protein
MWYAIKFWFCVILGLLLFGFVCGNINVMWDDLIHKMDRKDDINKMKLLREKAALREKLNGVR